MKKRVTIPKRARGVAILIVLVSLALMMSIVTDLSRREMIFYKLAINERDALKAEALAQSGANFAQIILTLQEPLQGFLTKFAEMGVELPAYTVWEMMPIDSDLLKGITEGFVPDLGLSGAVTEQDLDKKVSLNEGVKTKEFKAFGPYEIPEGGYGGFEGTFSTEIEDEEKKISLRKWTKHASYPKRKMIADQLFRLLNKPENAPLFDGTYGDNKNVSPAQLIGNIYDYINEDEGAVDVTAGANDWGRILVGSKKAAYDPDTPEIMPRGAPMDSLAELRLVPGMTDAIYRLLAKNVTIYGESDKINILTVSDEMLGNIFYICAKERDTGRIQQPGVIDELVAMWKKKRSEGQINLSLKGVMAHLEENRVEVDKEECTKSVGTDSKTFTVKSTATVGNVTKTLLLRLRAAGGVAPTIYQYQYL